MWMFGQVNQEEFNKLEKQGWEIIRQPSKAEIDKLCEPDFNGESEPLDDDEFFVLIYFDYDLSSVADDILAQGLAREVRVAEHVELERQRKLSKDRDENSDYAFENYDFAANGDLPDEATVIDSDGWECCTPGKERTIVFYWEMPDNDGPSTKGTFSVYFKDEKSAEVINTSVNTNA